MTSFRIAQKRVAVVDPHDCTDAADDLVILRAVCDTLVKRRGASFSPGLATRWQVDESARTCVDAARFASRFALF